MTAHDTAAIAMTRSTLEAVRGIRDLEPKSDLEKSRPVEYWKGVNSLFGELSRVVHNVEQAVRPTIENRRAMLQTYHEVERAEKALSHVPLQAKSAASPVDAEMVTALERIRLSDPHSSCEVPLVAEQYPPQNLPAPLPALPGGEEIPIEIVPVEETAGLQVEERSTVNAERPASAPLGEPVFDFKVEE
jgi:hypothetical protein